MADETTQSDIEQQDTTPTPEAQGAEHQEAPQGDGDRTQEAETAGVEGDVQVRKLRGEAASWRTKFRDAEKARDEAVAQTEAIRAALAKLTGDDEGEVSAEDQIAQLTEQRDEFRAQVARMTADAALRDALTKHGGDLDLAPGWIKGAGVLDDLDVSDDDYRAQVDRLVEAALRDHPKLTAQAARRSSGNAPTPPEQQAGRLSEDDLNRLVREGRYAEVNRAVREGKIDYR